MAAPELNDDAVAEILLRLPTDDPAALFRAGLVCKPWLRIVSDPAFLRLYRAFHRDGAPLLGFFYNLNADSHARFVSTTAASPLPPAHGGLRTTRDLSTTRALDCRHGRVLLRRKCSRNFVVLNPITGAWVELQQKPNIRYASYSAVVLYAGAGCNHGDCGGGPFLVVCVGNHIVHNGIYASVYSSKDGAWGKPVAAHLYCKHGCGGGFEQKRAAIIGDAMYCTYDSGSRGAFL